MEENCFRTIYRILLYHQSLEMKNKDPLEKQSVFSQRLPQLQHRMIEEVLTVLIPVLILYAVNIFPFFN